MPSLTSATYTNPLSRDDFPDPQVIHVPGAGYYAYATHDQFSPSINNIQVKHSPDLIHWSAAAGALLAPPSWAAQCERFWCPHVAYVNGEYRMYYAAEPDTKDGMCLALAVSESPTGFRDCGSPVNRLAGSTFEMIDPCLFIDPVSGQPILYYGSAHQPIRGVPLAADGRTFTTTPKEVLYPGDDTYHRLREGAFVTYEPVRKRYFLWVSGDNTWASQAYAVSVFWSDDPLGSFSPIPGDHVVLQANAHWDAPGHNCIITDAAGAEWMVYHAVDTADRYIPGTDIFLRRMCLDRVRYTEDGWPYVAGGSPSFEAQEGPAAEDG